MGEDVAQVVCSYHGCQKNQAALPQAPLQPWSWAKQAWSRLHLDIGGLKLNHVSYGGGCTRQKDWSVPLSNLTSFSTIQQLRTLLAQFSIPQTVVSDNGACFTNEEFREFMDKNGIHHVLHLLSSIQWTCRTCCMKDLKRWRHNLWKDSLFSVLLWKHSTQHYWCRQLIWCLIDSCVHDWIAKSLIGILFGT